MRTRTTETARSIFVLEETIVYLADADILVDTTDLDIRTLL
jgi:hypothetical protein